MWCVSSGCEEERSGSSSYCCGGSLASIDLQVSFNSGKSRSHSHLDPPPGRGGSKGRVRGHHSFCGSDTREGGSSSRIFLLDFSNAFNSISRECMFEEIRSRIPSLSRWVESCYGAQPILHFGCHRVLSCCGVQQGDPLCFALTLQPIIEKLKRQVPDLSINTWYLDDGTLCGFPEDLSAALKIIEEDGSLKGLHLNRSKSLLYIPADGDASLNTLPEEIPIARVGFSLLGSPIGPASYCESTTSQRVAKIQTAVKRLRDREDAQVELTLLRSCLALPKFNYTLRTCPPAFIHQATACFDT